MTTEEDQLLFDAKRLLRQMDIGENDSTQRKVAIQLIAGPADGLQTERLLKLAIAMAEARRS